MSKHGPKSSHRSPKRSGARIKSKKQVGLLLSKGSPLSMKQKAKLKRELHAKVVKVKK